MSQFTRGFRLNRISSKRLAIENKIIMNKEVPLTSYKDSYLRDRLRGVYHQKVFLPMIIDRAEKHGFFHLLTDETTPQWKQVLQDCNVKVTCALSPQTKRKMERPMDQVSRVNT